MISTFTEDITLADALCAIQCYRCCIVSVFFSLFRLVNNFLGSNAPFLFNRSASKSITFSCTDNEQLYNLKYVKPSSVQCKGANDAKRNERQTHFSFPRGTGCKISVVSLVTFNVAVTLKGCTIHACFYHDS
jgi:hypothetical protein